MAELTPDARRFLEQLRHLDDPTPAERANADAAVRRALSTRGMHNVPPLAEPALRQVAAAPERTLTSISRSAASSSTTTARSTVATATAMATTTARPASWSHSTAKLVLWGLGTAVVATLGIVGTHVLHKPHGPEGAAAVSPQTSPTARASAPSPPQAPSPAPVRPAREPAPTEPTSNRASRDVQQRTSHHKRAGHSSLAEELRFLSSVDAQIRAGSYDRALERLADNTNSKGAPRLLEERTAMRVLALCGRQDKHAARARDAFLRGSPNSVLAARVRAACAAGPEP